MTYDSYYIFVGCSAGYTVLVCNTYMKLHMTYIIYIYMVHVCTHTSYICMYMTHTCTTHVVGAKDARPVVCTKISWFSSIESHKVSVYDCVLKGVHSVGTPYLWYYHTNLYCIYFLQMFAYYISCLLLLLMHL